MKVCLVNNYYPPYVGGIETYVSNLASSLARRGHDVTVYCSSRRSEVGTTLEQGTRVVRFQTPVFVYGMPVGTFPRSFIADEFDVIHCNFPNPYFAAVCATMGRLRGITTVLTWHNDLPSVTPTASVLVDIHERISPAYLGLYDTIIATTDRYARTSKTLQRYHRKVKVIMNGVDSTRFNPLINGDIVREKLGVGGRYVVLFVGALTRWHSYKGLDVLIEAFATASRDSPQMQLVIVGDGELAAEYRSLAHELKIGDRVHFAGGVDALELPQFYASCDVMVLPSKDSSEGFGLVLLEAMACGKPVIGSAVGGIPELIRSGENGLLVGPNDTRALASALSYLCQHGDVGRAMGRNGRSFAERHDWDSVASSVEAVYNSG